MAGGERVITDHTIAQTVTSVACSLPLDLEGES
jgi:hypothetical protein